MKLKEILTAVYVSAILVVGLIASLFIYFELQKKQFEYEARRETEIEKQQRDYEKKKRLEDLNLYVACVQDAEAAYKNWWEGECERLGLGKDCALPRTLYERLDDTLLESKNRCVRLYKN